MGKGLEKRRKIMKYSLAKIAEELGVSKATVSQVLNGNARSARISDELEKRILDFCKEVNYVPNIHARRLNRKFSGTLGFLINRGIKSDSDNPFSDSNISSILGGAVLAAEELGFRVVIQLYKKGMNDSCVFEWLRNHEIDGLIYYGLDIPEKWQRIFIEENRSIVGIGIRPEEKISVVNIDNFGASYELTEHLITGGRKNFVYISGVENSYVSDERKRGFLCALEKNGIKIPKKNIISADYSEKKAEKLILERAPKADAIVCANDDMAIGAMKALKKLNVPVPEKTAVAGADNIIIGEYFSPSLTTFDNRQYELGAEAVRVAYGMINGKKYENIVLPCKIILREST